MNTEVYKWTTGVIGLAIKAQTSKTKSNKIHEQVQKPEMENKLATINVFPNSFKFDAEPKQRS